MRYNHKTIAIHVLFWLLYVASEYFANLAHMHPGQSLRFFKATLLSLPALIIPTYFMAFVVVPRFLKTQKWHWFIFWSVVVVVFVFFARIWWAELVNYLESGRYFKIPAGKMMKNLIRDYAVIALAICIYIIGDYRKRQKLNEELIKAKAEAEIKLLKGQLHPHFLFNSLNNIYSLALMKSDLAADSILKLTELLDYLVYRAGMDKVALSKEVDLLRNYVDLEKLRYGEKLVVESDLMVQSDAIQVAPLLLLPFAENCFKHGGPGKDGFFRIHIQLRADHHKLTFQITNSRKGNQEESPDTHQKHGGVGLENIRLRLALLYPDRHVLHIDPSPDLYSVYLEIVFEK